MANLKDTKDAIEEIIIRKNLDPVITKGKIGLKSGLIFDSIDTNKDDDNKSENLLIAIQEVLSEGFFRKAKFKAKFFLFAAYHIIFTIFCIFIFFFRACFKNAVICAFFTCIIIPFVEKSLIYGISILFGFFKKSIVSPFPNISCTTTSMLILVYFRDYLINMHMQAKQM